MAVELGSAHSQWPEQDPAADKLVKRFSPFIALLFALGCFGALIAVCTLASCCNHPAPNPAYVMSYQLTAVNTRIDEVEKHITRVESAVGTLPVVRPLSIMEQLQAISAAAHVEPPPKESWAAKIPGTVWGGIGTCVVAIGGGMAWLIRRGMRADDEPETTE